MRNVRNSRTVDHALFLERLVAAVVDFIIASIVASLIIVGLNYSGLARIPTPMFINSTSCRVDMQSAAAQETDRLWPSQPGEQRFYQSCFSSSLGTGERDVRLFVAWSIIADGQNYTARSFSTVVDARGTPVATDFHAEFILAYATTAILFIWRLLLPRTPGHIAMRLTVVTGQGRTPGRGRLVFRDALKFIPFFLLLAFQHVFDAQILRSYTTINAHVRLMKGFSEPAILPTTADIVTGLLSIGVIFVAWILPFLCWRGATWYDSMAGTHVVKIVAF